MLVNERSVRFGWYYRLQRPQSFCSTPTLATSANLLYSSNVIGSYIEKRKDKRKQSTLRKLKKIGSRPEVAILGPEPKKKTIANSVRECQLASCKIYKVSNSFRSSSPSLNFSSLFFVRWELNQIGETKKPFNKLTSRKVWLQSLR